MKKKLIEEAFKKAREERKKRFEEDPSLISLAEDISEYVFHKTNFRLGEKSYRNYLNEAKRLRDRKEDLKIKQIRVIQGLCDYTNYQHEICQENLQEKTMKKNTSVKQMILVASVAISVIITVVSIISKDGERWMTWQEDRYVEVKYDVKKFHKDELEPYDKQKMTNFRKIVNPNCNTQYFSKKGKKITWYYKRGKGDLEIFTSSGYHPTNGKPLKPITAYMIRTHICPNY